MNRPGTTSFSRVWPTVLDVGLTLTFVTVGQLDAWLGLVDGGPAGTIHAHRPGNAMLSFVGMSMLLLRRRAPLVGLAVMLGAAAIQVHAVQPLALFFGELVPILFMTYATAAYSPRLRTALGGLLIAFAGLGSIVVSVPSLRSWNEAIFEAAVLTMSWTVGYLVGYRSRRADAMSTRADALEREREQVIADERARLARELHDIVAHSVSVITIQAEAGEALLDEPDRAAEALRSIQDMSRQALIELRRLLGLLREPDGLPTLTPQPGLHQLGELIDRVSSTGLCVQLVVEGSPQHVEPGVGLSAYRIVQEALTNTLKHVGPTSASVSVRYTPAAVELEINDDGNPGVTPHDTFRTGHGLVGMRERVALYRGDLTTGTRPGGGFTVRARLPLEHA